MNSVAIPPRPSGLALALNWRRIRFTLILAGVLGLMIAGHEKSAPAFFRTELLGLVAMLAFGLFEQWPKRLPRWLARWVLQVIGVALSMPLGAALIYAFTTEPGSPHRALYVHIGMGILIAPWVALAALVRQKDALARHQALTFDLQRSELERQALDARLRLLQGQVAPHFLFSTLANVQALVDTGSPRASAVL